MKPLFFYLLLFVIFGCAPKSDGNKAIDRNLKSNAQEFMNSKLTYDIDKLTIYAHPILWEIIKLKFPEENEINTIKLKLKEKYVSAGIEQMNSSLNMKIEIGNIIDSISNNSDEYIYIINYERTGENKYDKIYAKSIIVAITQDKGSNWKFIDIDKDYLPQTKEFFLAIYPTVIVDRIFKSIDNEATISTVNETTFTPTNDIEINLLNQFNSYCIALFKGNKKEALTFIYPGVFENFMDLVHGQYSSNEVKSIIIEKIFEKIPIEKNSNKKFEIKISKILNKVEYGNSLIYVLSNYLM